MKRSTFYGNEGASGAGLYINGGGNGAIALDTVDFEMQNATVNTLDVTTAFSTLNLLNTSFRKNKVCLHFSLFSYFFLGLRNLLLL